jgi:hypothetical protein
MKTFFVDGEHCVGCTRMDVPEGRVPAQFATTPFR